MDFVLFVLFVVKTVIIFAINQKRKNILLMTTLDMLVLALVLAASAATPAQAVQQPWMKDSMVKLEKELIAKYGDGQRARLQLGMQQVSSFWRTEDGDSAAFEDFIRTNFAGDPATLDTMFERFER